MKRKSVAGNMIQSDENLSDTITSNTPLKTRQQNAGEDKTNRQAGRSANCQDHVGCQWGGEVIDLGWGKHLF